MPHYRESPRLKHFDYKGSYAYFITIVTRQRRRVFVNRRLVYSTLDILGASTSKYNLDLNAYCFMPDHLHLLLTGNANGSLTDCIRHFKQISSFRYKKTKRVELWQTSFHDRVLRSDEALRSVAAYIWNNPVRAGLVEHACDYQFSGPKPLPGA